LTAFEEFIQMTKISSTDARKYLRFPLDPGVIVEIDLELKEEFTCSMWGILFNESYGGCGLVVVSNELLETQQLCYLRFEKSTIFEGKIVWKKSLEDNIIKLGVQYISANHEIKD
jgi:hypothetical protein